MKHWWVGSVLAAKVLGLSCVALMSTVEASPIPCHETARDSHTECLACELALEAWEEPRTEYEIILINTEETPIQTGNLVSETQSPPAADLVLARAPPDKPPVSLQAWQQTIRLRI